MMTEWQSITSDCHAVDNLRGLVAGYLAGVVLLVPRRGGPDLQVVPVLRALKPHLIMSHCYYPDIILMLSPPCPQSGRRP